jgi:hypothetical protein
MVTISDFDHETPEIFQARKYPKPAESYKNFSSVDHVPKSLAMISPPLGGLVATSAPEDFHYLKGPEQTGGGYLSAGRSTSGREKPPGKGFIRTPGANMGSITSYRRSRGGRPPAP